MVSWQKYKVALVVWSTVLNLNAKSDNWVRQEKNLTNKALFISFSYISSFHLFSLPFWVGPRSWNQLLAKGLAVELGLWNFIFSPKSPSVCHPSARAVLSAALPVDSLALQGLLWMFSQKKTAQQELFVVSLRNGIRYLMVAYVIRLAVFSLHDFA